MFIIYVRHTVPNTGYPPNKHSISGMISKYVITRAGSLLTNVLLAGSSGSLRTYIPVTHVEDLVDFLFKVSAWLSPSYHRHLGSEPKDRRFFLPFCLFLSNK